MYKETIPGRADLIECGCQNWFMDVTYGKRVRVANVTEKGDPKTGDVKRRCCSCGEVK